MGSGLLPITPSPTPPSSNTSDEECTSPLLRRDAHVRRAAVERVADAAGLAAVGERVARFVERQDVRARRAARASLAAAPRAAGALADVERPVGAVVRLVEPLERDAEGRVARIRSGLGLRGVDGRDPDLVVTTGANDAVGALR